MRGVGKLVVHPFFSDCASRSSVATGTSVSAAQSQEPKAAELNSNPAAIARRQKSENGASGLKMKSSTAVFLVLPNKSNISNGVHKFLRSLKNFSHLFVYRKEEEEEEVEMEIGYPTDVKHVTHIGLDGSTNTNLIKGWENLNNFVAPQILSFPSISLRQFELSMAAQTHDPLLNVKNS